MEAYTLSFHGKSVGVLHQHCAMILNKIRYLI